MKKRSLLRMLLFFFGFAVVVPATLQAVPNLIGTWTLTTAQGVVYSGIGNPSSTPTFYSGAPTGYVYITHQQGRAFAGYSMDGTTKVFLVGVIAPDNSVSIQASGPNSSGWEFGSGKYSVVNGKPTMKFTRQRSLQTVSDPNLVTAFIEAAYVEIKKTSSSVPTY